MGNILGNSARKSARPPVNVVLVTHNRPTLMRKALESILSQDYPGLIVVTVVFDNAPVDYSLTSTMDIRHVQTVSNSRTPGLAGARNTGILTSNSEYVAFCDDDDTWQRSKLSRQIELLKNHPDSEVVSTAMTVDYDGTESVRRAGKTSVPYEDFLRSRMAMVHSSSLLFRKLALVEGIGLVDESIPNSMCEDWDLLIRASKRHPVLHVDEPLIRVLWGGTSYFYQKWEVKNQAHKWMLENHPDILTSRVGSSRVFGQLAFGYAALKQPKAARNWAFRALRANWREPRAYLAMAVATGLVSDKRIVDQLQRRGRGI
ncbi:glycosyltransferase family 2 protein [Paeniglutamicibacter gangotriensis]|uniref:glycosyltransferase family 2 protein n=1 Tax=Paeniglutamicibacter gangotriensis TaxID=254787 RepID=UPI0037C538EB